MEIAKSLGVFALALVLVAYIPGRMILRIARITAAPLDVVVLSSNLGLVLSAMMYWFLASFSGQQYFIFWIVANTGTFAFLWRKERAWPRFCVKGPHLLLVLTILLGLLLLAVLPVYYSNLTVGQDGSMKVSPFFDVPLHAAIARELTNSIPPQNPVFSGRALSYHVAADLPASIFACLTGLGIPDLTTRFIPTFFLIATILSVFCFSRLWLASDYGAALVAFLVAFGEDLSFVPGLLQASANDWSVQYFSVPSVFSLFAVNPMLPALGLLFAGLYCLLKCIQEQSLTWQLLAGLFFAALSACKIFTAVHLGMSLALTSAIYFAAFRNHQVFQWAVITGLCSAPALFGTFLSNGNGAQVAVSFFQSHALGNLIRQLALKTQFASFSPSWLSLAIALPVYLIGSLGLRIIGIPSVVREVLRPRPAAPVRFLLAVFVLSGVILGLVVTILPKGMMNGYDNGVWFYVESKYVFWIFAVEAILVVVRSRMLSRRRAAVVAAFVVAASLPSAIQHFASFGSACRSSRLSPNTVRLLEHLRIVAHPGEVVLSPQDLVGPILALTNCHVPVGRYAEYMISAEDYQRRTADMQSFWTAWQDGHAKDDILRANGVNYLVISKQQNLPTEVIRGLAVIFENSDWIVYRVTMVGSSHWHGGLDVCGRAILTRKNSGGVVVFGQMNQRWSV